MRDPRARLCLLALLALLHGSADSTQVPSVAALSLGVLLLHRQALRRTLPLIVLSVGAITVFSVSVALLGLGLETSELLVGLLRWASLISVTVVLAFSVNSLEIMASLRAWRVPAGIALALGVGFRFMPVLVEEVRRIRLVQNQYGLSLSPAAIQRFGVLGVLQRQLSPIIVMVLRRVDTLVISIAVNRVLKRAAEFEFSGWNAVDGLLNLGALGLILWSFYGSA